MIITVPFFYFSLLTFYLYRKSKQIDIPVLMSSMYAICGLFSIFVEILNLRYGDSYSYTITPSASFAYCGLLTLTMLPLIIYRQPSLKRIKSFSNDKFLRRLAYVSVVWFLLSSVLQYDAIMRVLTGDMGEIRTSIYKGDLGEDWMLRMPAPLRYLYTLIRLVVGCPWTMIFLAFFSRYVQLMPQKFFYMFLLVSFSGPFNGIIGADRSATAYWIIAFFTIYNLFRNHMTESDKKGVRKIGYILAILMFFYLSAMTISRFGDNATSSGMNSSESSLISYFGQNYFNFCYYFENYEPPFTHLGILFPFTSQFIFGIPSGGTVIQKQMDMLTGYTTGVFYTFIGQIIISAGKSVAIIFCILMSLSGFLCMSKINKQASISASSLYLYYAYSSVILFGLFGHYYATFFLTTSLICIYILLKLKK